MATRIAPEAPSAAQLMQSESLRTFNDVMETATVSTRAKGRVNCSRCGSRMLMLDENEIACLSCGHRDYGKAYQPLRLAPEDIEDSQTIVRTRRLA